MAGITDFIGPALSIFGTLTSANAQRNAGAAKNMAAQFEANQLDVQAGQYPAAAQRVADASASVAASSAMSASALRYAIGVATMAGFGSGCGERRRRIE